MKLNKIKLCGTQPILPTAYSEALSYLEDINKLRERLNDVIKVANAGQTFYVLPIATEDELGGVKAIAKTETNMNKVAIDADGQIWSSYPEMATDTNIGLTKGGTAYEGNEEYYNDITAIDEEGTIWYHTPQVATEEVAGLVRAKLLETIGTAHEVGVTSDGKLYSDYPTIASTELGLVKGARKTSEQTTPVGIDVNGNMWVNTSTTLETASATALGGVKANAANSQYTGDVRIDSNGFLKVKATTTPIATANSLGGIKANAKVNEDNPVVVDSNGNAFVANPTASATTKGVVTAKTKEDENVEVAVDANGKLWVPAGNGSISVATDTTLGGIKAKARSNEDRKLSIGTDGFAYYKIPAASASEIGGIKAEPRNDDDTTEVRVDPVTNKLYTKATTGTITKATSTTIGGIIANPRTSDQTQSIGIASDGQLYTAPATVIEASTTNLGGIKVSAGGNDAGAPPTQVQGFYPNAADYPLLYGRRVPYSVFTQTGGALETYNTHLYLDLSEETITPAKLGSYFNYCTSHAYYVDIYAKDNSNVIRLFEHTDSPDKFVSKPYEKNGNLQISVLTTSTDPDNEYATSIEDYPIDGGIAQATATVLGGIKARPRTTENNEVFIDKSTGRLYTEATGGTDWYEVIDLGTRVTFETGDFEQLFEILNAQRIPIIRMWTGTVSYIDYHLFRGTNMQSTNKLSAVTFMAFINPTVEESGSGDTSGVSMLFFSIPTTAQTSYSIRTNLIKFTGDSI